MLDTYDHTDFPAAGIRARLPGPVSVVVPARNTAGTIVQTVAELLVLAEAGIVTEVIVVDADSADGTAAAARDAGAQVVSENELLPEYGPVLGKGDAMWRALEVVSGDIVVYVDGDIADFGRHYVTGLLGPLCADPDLSFVKGSYRRPFRQETIEQPTGGGRVTELTARPLLARTVPELAAFEQPLAGEIAARRTLLESIPFHTGYGVEIAMLVAVWDRVGIEGMAQAGLGTKRNSHQPLAALGGMAGEVIDALAASVAGLGRDDLGTIAAAPGAARRPVVRPARAGIAGCGAARPRPGPAGL
jgi:glucosyl-3-phosphoglycerate synthase